MDEVFKEYVFDTTNIGKIKKKRVTRILNYQSNTCGDNFRIYLIIENDKIIDIKYQIFGCIALMAGSAATSQLIKGKGIEDIKDIKDSEVLNMLGDYPKDRTSCILKMLNVLKSEL